ncbi:MAG: carboxypeptidase-like regulatory domain-containing protein [Lewinellaceae bacterium]|nr:carboxypeptidase-like regulatory domain-containing protein [Lewinellaceae bacterium]
MRLLTATLLLLWSSLAYSQILTITGTVQDADNGKPLAYAHVGIPEKGIGTVTGEDGSFTLKVPEGYRQSKLSVSFIGYATYEHPLSGLSNPVTIRIKAVPSVLQEVVVMDERAVEDIIRRAVRRIPDNYPPRPTSVTAFYRESRTNAVQEYLYMAEGVLDVYKTSYRNSKEGQVGLIQGRKVILSAEEVEQHSGFSSGHMAAHRFDFVKNREDFIDEAYFDDYKYWIESITYYEGKPVYVIGFGRAEGGKGRMKGSIYIDTLSYAFLRARFEILPEGLRKIDDYPLYAGNWKANRYTVNYRKVGEEWYFSNALREGVYRDGGVYSNEIAITEIQPGRGEPVPYLERLNRGDEFLDITGEYDENFWNNYNTTPLSSGLRETVVQMRNQEKAQEVFDSLFIARLQTRRDSVLRANSEGSEFMGKATPPMEKPDGFKWRFQTVVGSGAHFLETGAAGMRAAFLEHADGPAILDASDEWVTRSFEPIAHLDFNLFFRPNLFIRGGWSRDLWNSVYRERSLGVGTQVNLSKGRPFFVRAVAQHSHLKYARKIGAAENDYGKFKADKKRFNADRINLYYGSRIHSLKLSLELALELHPGQELFIRGGYMLPFARQQHVYLKERRQLFNKKERLPLDDRILVERNGEPYDGRVTPEQSFLVTVGLVFK